MAVPSFENSILEHLQHNSDDSSLSYGFRKLLNVLCEERRERILGDREHLAELSHRGRGRQPQLESSSAEEDGSTDTEVHDDSMVVCCLCERCKLVNNLQGVFAELQNDEPLLEDPETDDFAHQNCRTESEENECFFHDLLCSVNSDRILYYAMYIQYFGISAEEIERMEELMHVIYGTPPPITYSRHVLWLNKTILEEYNRKRYFFCRSCDSRINEWREMCENRDCKLFRVNLKRAKGVQKTEVHVVSIIPQLSDLIKKEIREIIEFHRFLHDSGGGPTLDRSDVRYFEGFYRNIESVDDFNQKRLRILLSLSIDGFVLKRITRREMWPLYLRMDNIAKCEGDKYINSILSGVIYCLGKPSLKLMETLFSRLESEMNDLRDAPIEVYVDDVIWTIEVSLYRGVADMAAQKALFGVPRWSSKFGCSKCYIAGQRVGSQRKWIATQEDDLSLRQPDSYVADGRLGRNGVPKETPIMRVIKPCDFPGDALHVCSEGVTKDRIRDLFGGECKFPDLRLDGESIEAVKKTLREMSSYTYSNAFILSLEDLRTSKAAELDEIAFVVFPLTAAVGVIPSPIVAASLLGYWLCVRIVSRSRSLTTTAIRNAQELARLTKNLWTSIAPQVFTMKCHWFFEHSMREEIECYGSVYQWSSAPFESHHRRLQIRVDQATTNSSKLIIERYLLYKKVRYIFEDCCANNSAALKLKEKVDNKNIKRFPVGVRVDETMHIPKGSRVDPSILQENHRIRISRSGEDAYSRLIVRGKVYSSRVYWKRPSHSRQDMVFLRGVDGVEDVEAFGSIVLFLYNRRNRTVRVLLDEFKFCNPFSHLGNLVHHTPHPLRRVGIELMRFIEENNVFFQELTENCVRVRPASLIKGACTSLKFGNHHYASML